ncbi:hypothetical protein [Paraburkholderia sp. JPY419]|uniref:hypothetical protein n=1 Tax=Paraburkholderia sp. JPY419 TaxID=667660 RepID=UPI003D1A6573
MKPSIDTRLETSLNLESAHVCFEKGGLLFLVGLEHKVWRVFGKVPDILDVEISTSVTSSR